MLNEVLDFRILESLDCISIVTLHVANIHLDSHVLKCFFIDTYLIQIIIYRNNVKRIGKHRKNYMYKLYTYLLPHYFGIIRLTALLRLLIFHVYNMGGDNRLPLQSVYSSASYHIEKIGE